MNTQVAPFSPIDRRRFAQMCAGSLALAAIGCGPRKDRAYSRGSTVIIGYGKHAALDPGEDPKFLVFLPLLAENERGELKGRLAKDWAHSPDYREWTYHLRTDVRWHEGTPVTAHDVRFALELLSHPDVADLDRFESLAVLDDSTIRVRAGHSHYQTNYYQTNFGAYPRHLLQHLEPKNFYHWDFWDHPVGNGPYRFVRYLPETMIEFEANPDYYGGKPRIERLVLKFVGNEAALGELLSGNVDALSGEWQSAGYTEILRLSPDPRFRVYHQYRGSVGRAVYWQNDHPLFRDPRVRKALTLAINRREMLQAVNQPDFTPIVDGPYSVRQLRRGDLPDPLPYDPATARALLDAAGWHDRKRGGVRERDGQPFHFTVLADRPPHVQIAVYMQGQLRRVGVEMTVHSLPYETIRAEMKTGHFEAALIAIANFAAVLERDFGKDSPIGFKNPEVAKLIDRLSATADPDAEDQIYRKITEIFRAEIPATYISPIVDPVFAHRRLRGLSSPWRAEPVRYMEDLWLEDRSD